MKKEITSDRLAIIKTELSAAESAVKRVPISNISVDDDTLRRGSIIVGGDEVPVSNAFFRKLGSMLKVNQSLTRDMIKNGDTKVAAALINGLKDYQFK